MLLKTAVQPRINTEEHGRQWVCITAGVHPTDEHSFFDGSVAIRGHPWLIFFLPQFQLPNPGAGTGCGGMTSSGPESVFSGCGALAKPNPCSRSAAVSAAHTVQTGRRRAFSAAKYVHRMVNQKLTCELSSWTSHAVSRRDGGGPPTASFRLKPSTAPFGVPPSGGSGAAIFQIVQRGTGAAFPPGAAALSKRRGALTRSPARGITPA